MDWYFFEPVNQELRTIPAELLTRAPVAKISWRPGIGVTSWLVAGTVVGDAHFNDGTIEPMPSPVGGTITAVQPKIRYAELATGPSQWLLRIDTGALPVP